MSRYRITSEDFINRAKKIHGDKFDYSKVRCTRTRDYVEIVCSVHGSFFQEAREHLRGNGCIKCRGVRIGLLKRTPIKEFINRCNSMHNNQYDYSLCNYQGANNNIIVVCKKHGEFVINAMNHIKGQGCKYCKRDSKRKGNKEFIEQAIKIHGQKYDYSLVDYVNCRSKVSIICPNHGVFHQVANSHLQGSGCRKCSGNNPLDNDEFIERIKAIHGDKYDYSNTEYINAETRSIVKCRKHGDFSQTPGNILNGHGCPICGVEKRASLLRKNNENFIREAALIHSGRYDYSLSNYFNSQTRVSIICPDHGVFEQVANSHLAGAGCPYCNRSKGELSIEDILNSLGIGYERQKKYVGLKRLRYDFYLTDYNLCIEYNGHQHYRPIDFFGGFDVFIHRLKLDSIKKWFCMLNNIQLLSIPYWEKNIEVVLKNKLDLNKM